MAARARAHRTAPPAEGQETVSLWFVYNSLHLALTCLARGNLYAAERYVRELDALPGWAEARRPAA